MKMHIIYRLFALLILINISVLGQSSLIAAGPMLGYAEMTEVAIWVDMKMPGKYCLSYKEGRNQSIPKCIPFSQDDADSGGQKISIPNLKPGTQYQYNITEEKNIPAVFPYQFNTKKLWQWRENAPDFKIAFGSCAYINESEFDRPGIPYGSDYEIFNAIATKSPDITIWGGDNIYLREADWDSPSGIYHRYNDMRRTPQLQKLLQTGQHFAIWDDHDFGTNDSDRSFYLKHVTQKAFKDFWPNKTFGEGIEQSQGIYTTFNWGDAQFFLLDNRFFKSPNKRQTGERSILGEKQKQWLIDNLVSSTFTFKIIVIGGQVLNTAAVFENYSTYEEERNWLLETIDKEKIEGVIFLSGDRHFSELSQLQRPGAYPLYDWTVSPLTSGAAGKTAQQENNLNRVQGSLFTEQAFGILGFSGKEKTRSLSLELFNKKGEKIWNKIILAQDLTYKK